MEDAACCFETCIGPFYSPQIQCTNGQTVGRHRSWLGFIPSSVAETLTQPEGRFYTNGSHQGLFLASWEPLTTSSVLRVPSERVFLITKQSAAKPALIASKVRICFPRHRPANCVHRDTVNTLSPRKIGSELLLSGLNQVLLPDLMEGGQIPQGKRS